MLKNRYIKPKLVILFLEQLSYLLEAGMDILSAFDLIIKTQSSYPFAKILTNIKLSLKKGENLNKAIQPYSHYFGNLTRQLISIGEQSGTLDRMLKKSAEYKEFQENIKKKIISALFYPCVVCIIAIIVTSILLIFVIPEFSHIFSESNTALPRLTKIIISFSDYVKKYSLYFLVCLTLASIITKIFLKKSVIFHCYFDNFSLKIPFLGNLIQDTMIIQSTNALAHTCTAGLPLLASLDLIIPLNHNKIHQLAWKIIKHEIERGTTFATAMQNTSCFSLLCIQLIDSGEHTGKLDVMLNEITRLTTLSLEAKLDYFKQSLEPLIMTILGTIIGILIIGMYLPIFKLGGAL